MFLSSFAVMAGDITEGRTSLGLDPSDDVEQSITGPHAA